MRIDELVKVARKRRLDRVLVMDEANVRALTGIACDNAVLSVDLAGPSPKVVFYTDFRYVPMVHRVAPKMKVADIRRLPVAGRRIGYEGCIAESRFRAIGKAAPRAKFVDILPDVKAIRSVKTPEEIAKVRAAEKLACEIWNDACAQFAAGMTERDMARIIQGMMVARGDGEAFATIVCVGAHAAECHHEPDGTIWNGRDPVLVDMGVKLAGYCSDLTRNVVPKRPRPLYRQVYDLVRAANRAAIAAARPGMTGCQLDKVARDMIAKGGFGKCFGHSLGHGVGLEIHEAPTASRRDKTVLKPGMLVTIEPGIYLEDNLGVRIEDLVLITETGCEVLSASAPIP